MEDKATLLLAEALADMKSRQGVNLADLEPGEVVALVRAVGRVAEPYAEVNADAAGIPVRVAPGVWFWHLTCGASVWLDEVERILPRGTANELYRLCLVYACCNARRRDAFPPVGGLRDLEELVQGHFRTLAATPQEINAGLDALFGLKPRETDGNDVPEAASWAAICSRLEMQTDIPADEWMWERSGKYMLKCYRDLKKVSDALGRGGDDADSGDELDDAVNALQRLKLDIMRRVKKNG